jgi:hypothetical protein
MVHRTVLIAWLMSLSAIPYPRKTAAIESMTLVLAASSGSAGPVNSAPMVAAYLPGWAVT